jgi:hypothetical protein
LRTQTLNIETHIVFVRTQHVSEAGFSGLLLLFFVKGLEVSGLMLIFATLKLKCGAMMPPL